MKLELHDMMYELGTALENHTESDGHEFELAEFDARTGNGEIKVTSPDGTETRFRVRLAEVAPADPGNGVRALSEQLGRLTGL